MAGKLIVCVGGQFGSEAKGHVAAQLARRYNPELVIRTGGPNAGHTVLETEHSGNILTHKLRQLPTAAVANKRSTLAIAAGGLVSPDLMWQEMAQTGAKRILVDRQATILEPRHQEAEEVDPQMQWGSTKEGIGAARADRLHRTAYNADQYWPEVATDYGPDGKGFAQAVLTDVAELARDTLGFGGTVLIEAAQGYGLGLHTKYYPKTTSADCRAIDALADVGISPWVLPELGAELEVWVVIRPYPIRVAGASGPLKGETTWQELGLPIERTTVTNKVRRVGTWDPQLVRDAVLANGGPADNVKVALTMMDQVVPGVAGFYDIAELTAPETCTDADYQAVSDWICLVQEAAGVPVDAITTGPNSIVWLDGAGLPPQGQPKYTPAEVEEMDEYALQHAADAMIGEGSPEIEID